MAPTSAPQAARRRIVTGMRWLLIGAVAVARRPDLWWTGVRQLHALAVTGWWRRWPFLPLPDPDYLAFRLQTMYGDAAQAPAADDLLTYLRWCRSWPDLVRHG